MSLRRKVIDLDNHLPFPNSTSLGDAEVIKYLEHAISSGKYWYVALLEAIGLWTTAEETHNGRTYRYLIDGEAFDWLLLSERLCQAVDGLLPYDEKIALLFHGQSPLSMTKEKFKELIGIYKYHQYLNYFYGITLETALILAVQDEVRKERRLWGYKEEHDTVNEVHRRLYGATKTLLMKRFRHEKGYPQLRSVSLTEIKMFTYWLFKYRMKHYDKAKVASDTKKALNWLHSHGLDEWLDKPYSKLEFTDL
jgi:hypothetical protein